MDPGAATEVHQHMAGCPDCRRALNSVALESIVSQCPDSANPVTEAFDTLAADEGSVTPELTTHARYRVLEVIGSGGMGAVFKAEHRLMERLVALKVINRSLAGKPESIDRFRREVKAAARLAHPHIVKAYDADRAGDTHFLVMEYVEGTNLAQVLKGSRKLPIDVACEYARQVALGLAHAHQRGMAHRDIKPANLMLTRAGQVKILDFGLARLASESDPSDRGIGGQGAGVRSQGSGDRSQGSGEEKAASCLTPDSCPLTSSTGDSLTSAGSMIGTADYMAPEQARDARQADIRADIYSLGCTLYHFLAGQPPFPSGEFADKVAAHRRLSPRPLVELRPDIPGRLSRVVERMLAKDPTRRYQTPDEVARALAAFAGKPSRSRWVPAVPAGAVLAIAAIFGCWFVFFRSSVLEIRSDDPEIQVELWRDGQKVRTLDLADATEADLEPGEYELVAVAPLGGIQVLPNAIQLQRGEKQTIEIKVLVGEVRRLEGHTGTVRALAFAPGGERAFSGSMDKTIRRWDLATGKEEQKYEGHTGWAWGVAVSADGRRLLSAGGYDGTIRLWDINQGQELLKVENKGSSVYQVAISPDGRSALSGGTRLRLWDLETQQDLDRFRFPGGFAWTVAFSQDGKRALTAHATDKVVRLWDVETGNELRVFSHDDWVLGAVFSPDEKHIASCSRDRTVRLWDATDGQELKRLSADNLVESVAFSPNGRHILSGENKILRLWDIETGEEVRRFESHEGWINALAISPDGRYALSGGGIDEYTGDCAIRLWRLPPPYSRNVRRAVQTAR
jgi:serine/threonine protein kinase/WD40 repeat protein